MRFNFTRLMTVVSAIWLSVNSGKAQGLEDLRGLEVLGTYRTNAFDESAAEIPAYDAKGQRLFVVNANDGKVDVISISDLEHPVLDFQLDIKALSNGGKPNSVAIHKHWLAVAVEADIKQDSGYILVFNLDSLMWQPMKATANFKVGALPDMVTFTNDGKLILSANEGEPSDDYSNDPEGSISIIDIEDGIKDAEVKTLTFNAWDDKKESLINRGVRIFGPGASVSQDLEPEYIAVAPNNETAFVTLQENNAFAVVDLKAMEIKDIIPMGYKDWNKGKPKVTEYVLNELVDNWPSLGTPIYQGLGNTGTVMLGGFSGMYFDHTQSTDKEYVFYAVPDRGPNEDHVGKIGTATNVRPFKLPNFQGRLVKFKLNIETGKVSLDSAEQIFLTAKDGVTPISGRGNIEGIDEVPVTITDGVVYKDSTYMKVFDNADNKYGEDTVYFDALPYDPLGGDMEGVLRDKNGYFWTCDENRPAIYQFGTDGKLMERYIPAGVAPASEKGIFFSEYGEGSGNNKYFEIYNATSETVDLGAYKLLNCSNGCNSDDPSVYDFENTGLIENVKLGAGETFVVVFDTSAFGGGQVINQALLDARDTVFGFLSNGNDAWAIIDTLTGKVVDIIGEHGPDPGQGWDVAGVTTGTKDHTLVRKAWVTSGNGDWAKSAGTTAGNSEWIVLDRPTTDAIPEGASLGSHSVEPRYYGKETLPAVYSKRRGNRGFEAIAYDSTAGIIYAFIQSPMYNPSSVTKNKSDVIRILGVSATDGTPVSEYVYLLERNKDAGHAFGRVDKIGDAVYVGGGKFLVLERDSSDPNVERRGKKFVFEINISGATNILEMPIASEMTENTLEQMTARQLAEEGIKPVRKRKVVNLPSIGYRGSDKPEGLALLPGGAIAVINDNDFGLNGAGVSDNETLGIITFEEGNMLDASNKDDSIKFRRWPILGMYQPDAIAAMEADGKTYYLTANEGDARDYDTYTEEYRIKDIGNDPKLSDYSIAGSIVDASGLADAATLQADENLGRLRFTAATGRDTVNKEFSALYTYGTRSFSVWDEFGNLIWDSGDELEKRTAKILGKDGFNATNDESGFDGRSDDKGPEPEAITVAHFNGKQYAFIGLERVGGVMVYDVTMPWMPKYVTYINNRDFSVEFDDKLDNAETLAKVGDLGPEGIIFIDPKESPNGQPVLVVANEVSGTTTIYGVKTKFDSAFNFNPQLHVKYEGAFDSGSGEGAAEISAYDPETYKLFTLNAEDKRIDIIDIKNPKEPKSIGNIDISKMGGGVNSIALKNGIIALAIEADNKQANGVVGLFNANGDSIATYSAGALPDMVTFSASGDYILVANEGEPSDDYKVDPAGSVTVIDITAGADQGTVKTADFTSFNGQETQLIADGVRIFGPGASASLDFEPEYITTTSDSIAYVILQENNAVAKLDIKNAKIIEIAALGFKDWSDLMIDASNKDGGINFQTYDNLYGIYQPDGATSYDIDGKTYVFTANEGDAREYLVENGHANEAACLADGGVHYEIDDEDTLCFFYINEARVKDLNLDATAFPNANELQDSKMLGRLKVDTSLGKNANGEFEKLYAFGGRSFSIWDGETGDLVWDSKDDFEKISAAKARDIFNANDGGDPDEKDDRSDDKGAEPEGIVVGKIDNKVYAFVGLERQGGMMIYDVTNPQMPKFDQYVRQEAGDASPEGMLFIDAENSPTGKTLVVLSNEVSGTVSIYSVGEQVKPDFQLQLLHYADIDGNEETALEHVDEFSALVKGFSYDKRLKENTLVVTSGDIMIPGPRYFAAENNKVRITTGSNEPGHADVAFANAFGVAASAVGNHELDMGAGEFFDAAFKSESRNDRTFPGSKFPWLAANVDFSKDDDFKDVIGTDGQLVDSLHSKVAGYTIKVIDGDTVGLVGASGPMFPRITSTGALEFTPGLDFTVETLAAEIQPSVDALKAMGVNKIVLLSHMQQISIEKGLAEKLRGVDVIVAGGSNTRMGNKSNALFQGDDKFAEKYPFMTKSADDEPVAVVNVDGDYKYLGRLVVGFNKMGHIIPGSIDPEQSGAYATSMESMKKYGQWKPDSAVVAIRDSLKAVIDAQFNNVVGYSSVYLEGRRGKVRTEETNLGNLTADANLWYANKLNPEGDAPVMVSIKNGGGIRTEIGTAVTPPGSNDPSQVIFKAPKDNKVTEGHLRATLRFDNGLVRLTVTAEELKDIMEHAVAGTAEGATPGQFPQIAGMSIAYNMVEAARTEKGNGQRIISLVVTGENAANADTVVWKGNVWGDASRTFNIVTLNFLANGGDSYPFADLDSAAAKRVNFYSGTGFGENIDYPDGNFAGDPGLNASFSYTGGEQDALAEYMSTKFTDAAPYDVAETKMDEDTRISRTTDVAVPLVAKIEIGGTLTITQDGGSTTLTTTVTPTEASNKEVTWSIEGDAKGATIDDAGKITASGVASGNGTITVKAVAKDASGVSATAEVVISGQADDVVASPALANNFRIFPNPSQGYFRFSQPVNGMIFSGLGATVAVLNGQDKVDLRSNTRGVYFLVLDSGERFKLIID